jgi:phenylalanyl-tRNA synthetase beta chain
VTAPSSYYIPVVLRATPMTNVSIRYDELVELVGKPLSIEEFVDRITMLGAGHEGTEGDVITFDVFPSRPDMYSVEGIARALRGFLGIEVGLPKFPVRAGGIEFLVDRSVEEIRPFGVGGVVRGVDLTDVSVASLVDLQEKLHLTVGRRRRKVAIGIHDLDKVTPPFTFRAVPPEAVSFTPLGMAETMNLREIVTRHEKGREYGPIVAGKPRFPIITDARGEVLSFPPVINGVLTVLTPDTRNLFLDVTGTDLPAVRTTLTILSTALAERGGTIETVTTVFPDRRMTTPDLDPKTRTVDVERANRLLGLALDAEEAAVLLRRMRYEARPQGTKVAVGIPAYRADILHDWDVFEDIGIAFGYDKVPPSLARQQTIGGPLPAAEFANTLRTLMVGYGYLEVMSLATSSPNVPLESRPPAAILNPVSDEFSVIRSGLLAGVLNMLRLNKHRELPQRVFEVGDVVIEGANVPRIAAATIHPKASFTEMKSLVQSLLRDAGKSCEVGPASDGNYIPGRCAGVLVDGNAVGVFGEVHPRVIEGYELAHPVGAFEIDVSPIR